MARVMSNIRSGPSKKPCYLRFINRTSRRVNVIWIDYAGYTINYGTLDPGRHFDIHSYEGHPWISEDSLTMTRMLLNQSKVFYPSPIDQEQAEPNRELRCYLPVLSNNEHLQNENEALINWKREYVYITLPVLTLLQISSEVVARRVHSRSDITSLDIPTRLKSLVDSYFLNHWNVYTNP